MVETGSFSSGALVDTGIYTADAFLMSKGNNGGRPPKPASVHQLHGTRARVKTVEGHESPEPESVMQLPPPPHTLSGDLAQRKWREKAEQLIASKVLKVTDLDALESYCIAYEIMCVAKAEFDIEGPTVPGASGAPVKNPAANVLKDAQTEIRQMGTLLGLNPSARTRINIGDKEKEKPEGLGALSKPRRR